MDTNDFGEYIDPATGQAVTDDIDGFQNVQDNPWIIVAGEKKLIIVCFDNTSFPHDYPLCTYTSNIPAFIHSANICTWNGNIVPVNVVHIAPSGVEPGPYQDIVPMSSENDNVPKTPIKNDATTFSQSGQQPIEQKQRLLSKKERKVRASRNTRTTAPKVKKDRQNLLKKLRSMIKLNNLNSRRIGIISPKKLVVPPAKGEAEIKPINVGQSSGGGVPKRETDTEGGTD